MASAADTAALPRAAFCCQVSAVFSGEPGLETWSSGALIDTANVWRILGGVNSEKNLVVQSREGISTDKLWTFVPQWQEFVCSIIHLTHLYRPATVSGTEKVL